MLLGLWRNFDQWSDRDLVTAKAATSTLHVESALREIQREARQFTLRSLREAGVPELKTRPPIDLYPRSHVDALEVYARPAREAAKVLERGGSADDAVAAFEKRIEGIVEADMAIAYRDSVDRIWEQLEDEGLTDYPDEFYDPPSDDDHATDQMSREDMESWLEDAERGRDEGDGDDRVKVIGWRRVIRPELSMHGTCGLCVVAATQWYTRGDLKAIHHLCKCVPLPVTKVSDPGLRWNAEDLRKNLDEIYGAAGGSTSGKKLKRTRVAVREHGELGPILTYSAKRGWEPPASYRPYTPPTPQIQQERLVRRQQDLEGTLDNLRAQLASGVGDAGGLRTAIWDVEQSLRDIRVRTAA